MADITAERSALLLASTQCQWDSAASRWLDPDHLVSGGVHAHGAGLSAKGRLTMDAVAQPPGFAVAERVFSRDCLWEALGCARHRRGPALGVGTPFGNRFSARIVNICLNRPVPPIRSESPAGLRKIRKHQ